MKYKIPIIIKTWASSDVPYDFEYISQSLPSLLNSNLPDNVHIIIYDDHSTDKNLIDFLKTLSRQDSRIKVFFSDINRGPNWAQEYIFSKIIDEYSDSPFFLTLDDDVIYHKDWYIKLVGALRNCNDIGVRGIFTALNMPFKLSCAELFIRDNKYLLKWKQPALNWLVPMDIYREIGPFKDEGIAYDTVYSHWLRLKHYPIICLVPSYVQNIGLLGAYCKGDAVTLARDFIGENILKRYIKNIINNCRSFPRRIYQLTELASKRLAPIRWGNDFIYEGISKSGEPRALFSIYNLVKLGWKIHEIEKRIEEILSIQDNSPFSLCSFAKSLRGKPTWIEYKWQFMPTIREYKKLKLGDWPINFKQFFIDIIKQLIPFHDKGVVHNKIRLENVYVSNRGSINYYLAWYGTELSPNKHLKNDRELINHLGCYVSKWTRAEIKEMFTVRYIETLAPEVLNGSPPLFSSDIFSAAMLIYILASEEIFSLSDLEINKNKWINGEIPNILKKQDETFIRKLQKCISFNPKDRFQTAMEVYKHL